MSWSATHAGTERAAANGVRHVVLVSPYELGRQPYALAHPAAHLARAGHRVSCIDLSLQPLEDHLAAEADLVAIHLAMHTATRIAVDALPKIKARAPGAALCVYGLYAPMNAALFRELGVRNIFGPEAERDLVRLAGGGGGEGEGESDGRRGQFLLPDRTSLPPLGDYASLILPDGAKKVCGFAETTFGCKHRCRHCPVVPVYGGRFRAIPAGQVLADIAQQVEAGAEHVSFGDPDFLNGPTHARRIVRAMAEQFPGLTFDATVKIQHLLRHAELLPEFARRGCLFLTSAVESLDDAVLKKLLKNHTRADFLRAHELLRAAGIALAPTFIPFTPWTTLPGHLALLRAIAGLGLVHSVPPVQLSIRLLVPDGSHLLHIPGFAGRLQPFDRQTLGWPWRHADPAVDRLYESVRAWVAESESRNATREEIFTGIWQRASQAAGQDEPPPALAKTDHPIPRMSEAWYCCAEPV